jgi:predicted phage tail protein
MWNGFRSYGNTYLRAEERLFLQTSPYMLPQEPVDVVTACHAGTPTPPNTPTEVTAQVVGTTVTLSWKTSMRATSYVVEAGSEPGLANLYNADVGNTTAINTAAPSGKYHVRVRAKNGSGVSAPSSEVSFSSGTPPPLPPPPTELAVQVSGTTVTVTWAASSGATSYVLEAGSAPGLANLYSADVGNTTALTTGAPHGTYHVRVRAKNGAGVSGASADVSFSVNHATPPCTGPPGMPANLTFTQAGHRIDLRWMPAPGSLSFVVEAGSAAGLADLFNGSVGVQPELAASPPAGTYFVRVRGVNACGTSQASNEVVVVIP